MILISNIGKMQFSKIYIPTLSLFSIILYYTILAITLYIFRIYSAKNPNITQIRVRNLIAIIKMKARENKQKIRKIFAIVILVIIVNKI